MAVAQPVANGRDSSLQKAYLIVGAGCFGVSTAYHLKKALPSAQITLLNQSSFPNPSAAGHDLNKIIRADYADIFYMKLALEAQEWWRSNPIFKEYYHESGMLIAEDKGLARAMLENFNAIGVEHHVIIQTPEMTKTQFDGVFQEACWDGVTETYLNPQSGWGEADRALQSMISAVAKQGVDCRVGSVSKLSLADDGACAGVILEDGSTLDADHVILCAGASTPKLLVDSAPNWKELHVGDRLIAAGAIQCSASYPPDQMYKLRSVPVMMNGCDHTLGESIPPTPGKLLKFNYEASFTNEVYHEESRQTISTPPRRKDQSTWSQAVPHGLKHEINRVVQYMYGGWIRGIKIENYRMCWDAITPNQDFIIDRHPYCQNLSIAGGGSFHSWKFLPVLGKYVVQMLQGTLDSESASRWAWDRSNAGGAIPAYLPRRDLKEIPGYEV